MFQRFKSPAVKASFVDRIGIFRKKLASLSLDGFLVPRTDPHHGEYIAPCWEYLHWLTGFSGSAGLAIILHDRAVLFVDGRYTIQAYNECASSGLDICDMREESIGNWLGTHLHKNMVLGYDSWLHSPSELKTLHKYKNRSGKDIFSLRGVLESPFLSLWRTRPPFPHEPIGKHVLIDKRAGFRDKLGMMSSILRKRKADATILTQTESVAWIFNIRGNDIPHLPVSLSYAIIYASKTGILFVEAEQITKTLQDYLSPEVKILPKESFINVLRELEGQTISLDEATIPQAVVDILSSHHCKMVWFRDPCVFPRARKNRTEITGARAAHLRDGVAVCRFLSWFSEALGGDMSSLDEISAARKMEYFRSDSGLLRDISFPTISAFGAHGALPHYRVFEDSNVKMSPGSLYLIDSGGQYDDGTTDITRTLSTGAPTDAMRHHFTIVLKAHMMLSMARFPSGTTGVQLDALARYHMWRFGLDYDHGTGHGVGSYLSVHEGPQRLSKGGTVALEAGMILSNEPGYYREGLYGIRIENLLLIRPSRRRGGESHRMFEFEILTLAPIDHTLIDFSLLEKEERLWLMHYHRRVERFISPLLSTDKERHWLSSHCRIFRQMKAR